MKLTKQSFEFDYEAVKNKALAQLKSGKPLLGKEGALGPLFKSFLEAALEAELDSHLHENKDEDSNRRNGHGSKQLRTSEGTMELTTPRDRSGWILRTIVYHLLRSIVYHLFRTKVYQFQEVCFWDFGAKYTSSWILGGDNTAQSIPLT